ncbi:MAG: DUF3150 domain-containing protein [gamma proteobacterium symbiont of Clathrolucina costata]
MTAPVNHLEQLAILQIDFDIWSGQVKLDDPDLKLGVGGELPPKELVELGRKYVINKAHLKPFNRLKTKARRLCLSRGMSFMNGFAVPIQTIDQISAELDKIADEMNDLKANFLANYDQWIDEWETKNPEYAQAIRAGALPKAVVTKRIGFDYQVFQVNPVNEIQSKKLNTMAAGLAGELMSEIVDEANSFFHSSLKGKESCQSNTQKTLKRICDKVDGLSFLDSRFLSVVELLNKTISGYAGYGKVVDGEQFYRILSATLILSSPDKIKDYAEGTVDLDVMANSFMSDSSDDMSIEQHENVSDDTPNQKHDNVVPLELAETSVPDELPDEDDIDMFFRKHVANGDGMFF